MQYILQTKTIFIVDGFPEWPTYNISANGVGSKFVFDANVTSYIEVDDWRVPGMAFHAENARSQWKH